ncbi:hypothetical protein P6166_14490 [Stenotrophomonas sp. HITSZ_GD]|uniref:hypothetical protein n=1 Tax=Stenotrophomonas sp. HITSZ_GD TaxID=3037248 RepID=UPI00240DB21B|nr:hypothetical protein [Stenotrophomonas sp. HITSZ_GD]MDG2526562.1 hypothetical protein [Stenotrophomonas sp. HITSZ_GD]
MPTRAQIEADLRALAQTLPVRGTADAAAFDRLAFAARIDELMRVAEPADRDEVCRQAEAMLRDAGLDTGPVEDGT